MFSRELLSLALILAHHSDQFAAQCKIHCRGNFFGRKPSGSHNGLSNAQDRNSRIHDLVSSSYRSPRKTEFEHDTDKTKERHLHIYASAVLLKSGLVR